jgi:VIT1/CCC1 family predicted Fe2+/Mn2+ transporter
MPRRWRKVYAPSWLSVRAHWRAHWMGTNMDKHTIDRYLDFLDDERNGAVLYTALAEVEKDASVAEVYRRMAGVERKHAVAWEERLREAGAQVPVFRPAFRTRLLAWLARRFGAGVVLPTVAGLERRNTNRYSTVQGAGEMAAEESSHARLLQHITQPVRGQISGGGLAQIEGRHRGSGGNALRAAVLGANDGLVSNLSLVMGVAGAQLSSSAILITGFAGLLAGAISMALGEWLSVQSSRELYTRQIAIEKEEIAAAPEEEAEELALIYQSRGLDEARARQLATEIMSNKENAIDTLAREELGIDPEELGGSAWVAAITSFLLFAAGAIIPLSPFIFLQGESAIVVSIGFAGLGLFGIGAATSLFTGRGLAFSGLRMVLVGLAAAAVTFTVGRLIGVNLGG